MPADTEESVGGYIKTSTQKMRMILTPIYSLIITGSGDSDFIDCFCDELHEALGDDQPDDIKGIWRTLRSTRLQHFRNHIAPYSSFPSDERPQIDLLVGLHIKVGGKVTGSTLFRTELFKATGTVVKRVNKPECIGTGTVLARSLVDQFFGADLSLIRSVRCAARRGQLPRVKHRESLKPHAIDTTCQLIDLMAYNRVQIWQC